VIEELAARLKIKPKTVKNKMAVAIGYIIPWTS